jgi:dihydroxyacetone kinase-like protein
MSIALVRARAAADEGAASTVPLQARRGRASYLGARSVGHLDPGAASSALLIQALARAAGAPG